MKKTVILVMVGKRQETVKKVQDLLTSMGCYIRVRLGIHDGSPESCSDCGFIMLEMIGDAAMHKDLEKRLNAIRSVTAKLVTLKPKP